MLKGMKCSVVLLGLFLAGPAWTVPDGKAGDEFRQAAEEYEDNYEKAIKQAAHAEGQAIGRYLELARTYKEMARIKKNAANLADEGKWDDIHWGRYRELEKTRDRLMPKVDWASARTVKSKAHGKDKTYKKDNHKDREQHPDNDFLKAAREYQQQAKEARKMAGKTSGDQRAMYEKLSATYIQMAAIKRDAANAARPGNDYDWSRYHKLSAQRDQLENRIRRAGKRD